MIQKESITREKALRLSREIFSSRYPEASFAVASGSIIRGQGAPHSDIDLVVVYKNLPTAYRESFFYEDVPVEAFVHDAETLQAFMEDDLKKATPAMHHMVATGIVLPAKTQESTQLQRYARDILSKGLETPAWRIDLLRYLVGDKIDDLKDERPFGERASLLYALYETIGELRLRIDGRFIATGKYLSRSLHACDPAFAQRLEAFMSQALQDPQAKVDIETPTALLDLCGGYIFDRFKLEAPQNMRAEAKWLRAFEEPASPESVTHV